MGVIIAILIFSIIVVVHEFGHFICAKLSGIRVLEFSVGMGPKLVQKKIGETMYSLRLIPAGGYCAMESEDAETDDPRGFRNAKLWKRALVLIAGPFNNFILGFLMIIIMLSMLASIPTTQVSGFRGEIDDSGNKTYYAQSYKTGLRHGDRIIEIDGTHIFSMLDINYMLMSASGNTHSLTVKREGETVELPEVTFNDELYGGVFDFGLVNDDKTPVTVIKHSGDIFMSMTHIVGMSLKQMLTGKVKSEEVSGPVGVVSTISETAKESEDLKEAVSNLVYMTALISINIGIFNLLPVPALDGGRLMFCLIEFVRRKPVKPEHEGYVHLAGMVLLFGIMIFATYNDIIRLFSGG